MTGRGQGGSAGRGRGGAAGKGRGAPAGRGKRAAKGPEKRLTVILKALDACNGACTFCSVGPAGKSRMSVQDLDLFVEEMRKYAASAGLTHMNITFHGGEPTLLGHEWIDRACGRTRAAVSGASFSMQSNLLSVTPEMMAVIERHRIDLGSSVDPFCGERRDSAGRDAFPAWLAGLRRVSEAGLGVGAIFVVTRAALGRARELLAIAESLGQLSGSAFGLQLNPVYPQGRAAGEDGTLVTPAEFGAFLVDSWRAWEDRGRRIHLAPFETLATHFGPEAERKPLVCSFGGACADSHVGVDFDLNVAGCGRRLDSHAFTGSLREHGLAEILETGEERIAVRGRAARLKDGECSGCPWFGTCHGGCPDDACLSYGDAGRRFVWCESMKMLFAEMEARYSQGGGSRRHGPVPVLPKLPRPRTTVEVGRLPSDFAPEPGAKPDGAGRASRRARWIEETDDGAALAYDSGLDAVAWKGAGTIAIRVHNRHARSLMMWEDLVRDPRASVVLFEADGLDRSINLLNSLGASMSLDVPSILAQPGGAGALAGALERFLSDKLFKSRVEPFASALAAAVHSRPVPLANRFGLEPGCFEVASGTGGLSESLRAESGVGAAGFVAARRPCLACERMATCGGRLAAGDGKPCDPAGRALLERISAVAAEIARDMGDGA